MTFKAAVFDLDGTIVDNMPLHAEAFAIFAARHGLPPMTAADRRRLDGKRNREIFPDLFGRALTREELRAFETEKESLYRSLSVGRLAPLAGFERLVAALGQRRIPVAMATSAPSENVRHTLSEIRLDPSSLVIVRGDEVARGKPWPDVFLEAAARLAVPPALCVAFEDAPVGIAAAAAAGMRTVALTTSFTAGELARQDRAPDHAVADFEEYLQGPGRWLLDGSAEGGPPPSAAG